MYTNPYFYQFQPYYDEYHRFAQGNSLITDIQKAINGEYGAIACYEKLAQMAPTEFERDQILEIRKDELRHFEEFSRIYLNLTGRQPTPEIQEECPDTYRDGLEFAFRDEQKTVDFYLEISEGARDILIKKAFRRAASDEQNHAVWFLYFMQKNQG